jgi:hypothetical protein
MPLTPEQLTIIGLLFAIGAAGLAKKWVWGWVYEALKQTDEERLTDMTEDRDFWRDLALQLMNVNDKAIDVASKKAADV